MHSVTFSVAIDSSHKISHVAFFKDFDWNYLIGKRAILRVLPHLCYHESTELPLPQLQGPWLLVWCSVNLIKNIHLCLIVSSQENETGLATEAHTVVVSQIFTFFRNAFQHWGVWFNGWIDNRVVMHSCAYENMSQLNEVIFRLRWIQVFKKGHFFCVRKCHTVL